MANPDQNDSLDNGALLIGTLLGLLVGTLIAIFKAPQSGLMTRQKIEHNLREKLESVVPADPVAESMAEGKSAALRRQVELGLKSGD